VELIDLLFRIFVWQPGFDEVIMPAPEYSPYAARGAFFGAVVKFAMGGEHVNEVVDDILAAITPRTRFVLLSRPNNPSGKVMPQEDVKRILESGVLTIVDEAYAELADGGTSLEPWLRAWQNLIILRTFSKGFGLAGLRLGYILTIGAS